MDEAKGLIITIVVTLLVLGGGIFLISRGGTTSNGAQSNGVTVDQAVLIHQDSHQTNPGALVNIVEFGDYRCSACKEVFPITQQIIKDYGTQINFVFRNYAFLPDSSLDTSPTASTLAANAAECAADLGKYWEMHDWLYTNQPAETDIKPYTVDNLTKVAGDLKMDKTKFMSCLTNKTNNGRVEVDNKDAQTVRINGTPTFFVNGQMMNGVPTYQDFKPAIENILNKK
jgi:protein-disulfide isomerase